MDTSSLSEKRAIHLLEQLKRVYGLGLRILADIERGDSDKIAEGCLLLSGMETDCQQLLAEFSNSQRPLDASFQEELSRQMQANSRLFGRLKEKLKGIQSEVADQLSRLHQFSKSEPSAERPLSSVLEVEA